MTSLIVDSRERWFPGLTTLAEGIDYEQRQLEIGDFYFEYEGQCLCLLERKSESDFLASIRDGRYREQKNIMQAAANTVLWIVEGTTLQTTEPSIWTACMKLMIRNKQSVVFTQNKEDTTKLLETLLEKIRKKPSDWTHKNQEKELGNEVLGPKNVRSVMRNSYTTQEFVCTTLALVQGISYESARTIVKNTGWEGETMRDWVEFLETKEPEWIATIQMTKSKKVGKVLTRRICDLFLGKKM